MSELVNYQKRILELAPDVAINSISLNSEGLLNDVVFVNGELVFRFPKHEYGFRHLKDETRILRLLKSHITLEIPTPIIETDDCLAYRMIPGETLRRHVLMRLQEDDQQAIADQLAQFLKELHHVPIDGHDFPIRVNGIIDFGCAGLGDPAIDFGVVICNYGESFLNRFYRLYPEAESYLKRARFYAGAHEVRWLLTGVQRNDPWWFAVHVGSAKDVKY